ncbi:MAG: hypothetical protein K5898_13950 [Ruminococcus sp.]|uniref:flavodoxin n=1 Tax=Ruminococcus sp. TaxID=41978 RepID=UPI0025FBA335|nr:flavodoxin [Ruminococcus sp.]MCR4796244.1 hypothetical protein [Ruminococcus sp.]
MDKAKAKRTLGIIVDIAMYGLLLAQMLYVFTGNTVHEVLGTGFFVCLVIHIIIKRKWYAALFNGSKKPVSRRVFNISTVLLMLCCITLAVSSMGVSRLIFPWFRALGSSDLHKYLATAVLALSVFHGGMCGYIRTKKKKKAGIFTALGCIAAIAVGLALVPYLNRHFKLVDISLSSAVDGEKVQLSDKPLVVYFTRVGNTDFEDDVDAVSGASLLLADGQLMGNDQLLAEMIKNAADCETKAITLTGKKYPSSYGSTVTVAGKELHSDARPEIEPIDVSGYNSVILIYPLWWGTVPMPVATFLENNDLSGKKLYLIATQGSSGFGSSTKDIRKMAKGADVEEVMSIYCDDIPYSRDKLVKWLESLNKT